VQTLSLFTHTRFNQWKFTSLLSRADFKLHLTLSWALYLPLYSLLPLTFPEFRRSIVFYPATNMSNLGNIGYRWRTQPVPVTGFLNFITRLHTRSFVHRF
jgi:hypothetical protein